MSTNDVRVEIYRGFGEEGRAPGLSDIAARLSITETEVEAALRELDAADVIALKPGTTRIWLAHPFSNERAPFKVRSGGRTWDAICVWDALGVLALLERDGDVSTKCPDCEEELVVSVNDDQVSPSECVVHFGVPASRWYEDIAHT